MRISVYKIIALVALVIYLITKVIPITSVYYNYLLALSIISIFIGVIKSNSK